MIKKTILLCIVSLSFVSVASAQQVFKDSDLILLNKENVAKGDGTLHGKFSFTRDQADKDHAIKEIGRMTLMPGDSVGLHKHETNEDAYIIISGEGTFITADGQETIVKAGDITIARKGESHALKNSGQEPLVFLDVIAEQ